MIKKKESMTGVVNAKPDPRSTTISWVCDSTVAISNHSDFSDHLWLAQKREDGTRRVLLPALDKKEPSHMKSMLFVAFILHPDTHSIAEDKIAAQLKIAGMVCCGMIFNYQAEGGSFHRTTRDAIEYMLKAKNDESLPTMGRRRRMLNELKKSMMP